MKTCTWTFDESEFEHGVYHTSCKNAFFFEEGGIKENSFVYCPYCGGILEEHREPDATDADEDEE